MANTNTSGPAITPPVDLNKAYGAGGSALIGGAIAKIIIRVVNYKWPGLLDPSMTDGIDDVAVAAMAFIGAYLTSHKT
jgi:hypothetical protein